MGPRLERALTVLRHRTVASVLAAGIVWGGWEAFTALTAPRRIDPDLAHALERQPQARIAVTLGFAPEEFHVRLFQTYGVVSGVRGTTVVLDRVKAEDVRRLARYYWIKRIARQP
jgi:hypothetical protein